jgi:hypothetical protein
MIPTISMTLPMTRRLILPLAALCLGGAAGCVDLTEHPVTGLTSAYYNTPIGFDLAVNAAYQPMRNHWPLERGATMTVFGTDEYTKGADGSYKFFNDYTAQLNGDVDFIRDTWRDFYQGINTANTVIALAPTAAIPDATKNVRVAEAKFLRALYFFTLVRTFGDIPLPTTPTPLTLGAEATATNREPTAKVYDQIIKDLKEAEAVLPDRAAQFGPEQVRVGIGRAGPVGPIRGRLVPGFGRGRFCLGSRCAAGWSLCAVARRALRHGALGSAGTATVAG